MANLSPELIAKAKIAKSAEELLALAKENGIELTAEEANVYFSQLNANSAVSDDDLDAVSGGWDCPSGKKKHFEIGEYVKIVCRECGHTVGVITTHPQHGMRCVRCNNVNCSAIVYAGVDDEKLENAY